MSEVNNSKRDKETREKWVITQVEMLMTAQKAIKTGSHRQVTETGSSVGPDKPKIRCQVASAFRNTGFQAENVSRKDLTLATGAEIYNYMTIITNIIFTYVTTSLSAIFLAFSSFHLASHCRKLAKQLQKYGHLCTVFALEMCYGWL